jgi:hypothetical protein
MRRKIDKRKYACFDSKRLVMSMRTAILHSVSIVALLFGGLVHPGNAESIAVRYKQGAMHGFLALRNLDGKIIAIGDALQVVHGKLVTSELVFHFRDGSVDDDKAVYTQEGSFQLRSDHHVQRGPSFPKPSDVSIEVARNMVVSREPGNNGKDKVTTKYMDLPPDLANGIWLTLIENIRPTAAKTTLPFVASDRLIHLTVTPVEITTFRVGGNPKHAQHFQVKVDLGGVTGLVAPIIGKQPHDLHFYILEGTAAPGFVREQGQFFEDGPVWRIEQLAPIMH